MAFYQWSLTATSNGTSDPTMNWSEGIAPSIVNDNVRAEMARLAEYRDDTSGKLVTAGTSTAYTLVTNQILPSTPNNGQLIVFTPHVANGAAATLSADAGTAFPLQSAPGTALAAAALTLGVPVAAKFLTASSAWVMWGAATTGVANGVAVGSVTGAGIANATITGANLSANLNTSAVQAAFDGAGSVIVTNSYINIEIPFAGTITRWTIDAGESTTATVDVYKANAANPTVANKITASAPPSISASNYASSTTLTSWTTAVTARDIVQFIVTANSAAAHLTISLQVQKS
jgi:hypothetical protein